MKNSRRAASEARKEKRTSNVVSISPVYKLVFDMCEYIIRLPNSDTKRALMTKMGDLVDAMGDNRPARAKRIEAYWRGIQRENAIKREGWLTRTISMDDRPTLPKTEKVSRIHIGFGREEIRKVIIEILSEILP